MKSPKEYFSQRQQSNQEIAQQLNQQMIRLSAGRVGIFIFTLVAVVWCANAGYLWLTIGSFVIGGGIFTVLVNRYNQATKRWRYHRALVAINTKELSLLNHQFGGIDGGKDWASVDHPYSGDLDVFGENSLYQLLNRAQTYAGRESLANLLKNPHQQKQAIENWQEATQELTNRPDWCQSFAAYAMATANSSTASAGTNPVQTLQAWQSMPIRVVNPRYWIVGAIFLSVCSLLALGLMLKFFTGIYFAAFLATLAINRLVLYKVSSIAEDVLTQGQESAHTLEVYHDLIVQLENTDFSAKVLKEAKANIRHGEQAASTQVKRLHQIFSWLALRGDPKLSVARNQLYGILNSFLLLDVVLVAKAERWKAQCQVPLSGWFASVGQIETVASLGGFALANPSFVFPEISDGSLQFNCRQLAHPLIPAQARVANDCAMSDKDQIWVITGSNMAGKSTFLRTLGVNMVLAQIGATVCAEQAHFSICKIFTSMRTQDKLSEGVSAFYAELLRLSQLLEMLKEGKPVFFFLDELLKGTNSKDRYKGTAILLRRLKQHQAKGLISTHDLSIGELAETEGLANYSFNSQMSNGKLTFDYRLSKGLCREFNAQALMREVGIDIDQWGDISKG